MWGRKKEKKMKPGDVVKIQNGIIGIVVEYNEDIPSSITLKWPDAIYWGDYPQKLHVGPEEIVILSPQEVFEETTKLLVEWAEKNGVDVADVRRYGGYPVRVFC